MGSCHPRIPAHLSVGTISDILLKKNLINTRVIEPNYLMIRAVFFFFESFGVWLWRNESSSQKDKGNTKITRVHKGDENLEQRSLMGTWNKPFINYKYQLLVLGYHKRLCQSILTVVHTMYPTSL